METAKLQETHQHVLSKTGPLMALATLCTLLWGSAPSGIKLGYQFFQIDAADTMTILLFAGIRFMFAGILVIIAYSIINRKVITPKRTSATGIICLALSQTALQYLLYYIGTAHATGVKVSILSGSSTFFCVFVASLIFRQEKLTVNKVTGCILGLAGIILINLHGSSETLSLEMSFLGEGFILLSTIANSFSSAFIRHFSQKDDPVMLSGYQFTVGGLMLIIVGLAGGGRLTHVTPEGIAVLFYLCCVSAVAYTVWSMLLKHNPVSRVTIYNFLMPIFGVILSTILLGEKGVFNMYTLASLALVCGGICLVNFVKSNRK